MNYNRDAGSERFGRGYARSSARAASTSYATICTLNSAMEETREPMVSRTSTPSSKSRENKGLSACLLFGSALSDEFDRRRSNLDLLVEFEPQEPADRANSYFGLRDDLVGQTTVRAKSMRFELRTAAVQQKFDPVDLPRNMDEVLGSTQTCRAVI